MAKSMNELGLQPHKWVDTLDTALMVRRASVNRSTGFTPARLVLGMELGLLEDLRCSPTCQRLRATSQLR